MEKIRFHDKFYLNEDRREKPKECFVRSAKYIQEFITPLKQDEINFIDIGCASGDFIWYLNSLEFIKKKNIKLQGADIRKDLLDLISERIPEVKTSILDISSKESTKNTIKNFQKKFDISFMCGVNAIFDNCEWIKNISYLTLEKGFSLIFGPFNDSNLDVLVGIRESGTNIIQSGWNTLSINTLKSELDNLNRTYDIKVVDFEMPFDLPQQKDPLRAFTLNTKELGRIQVNGASIIRPQKFVLIKWDI